MPHCKATQKQEIQPASLGSALRRLQPTFKKNIEVLWLYPNLSFWGYTLGRYKPEMLRRSGLSLGFGALRCVHYYS